MRNFSLKNIKEMLKKDIMNFHLFIKSNIKSKQKPINNIRLSLREILELYEYDFLYMFLVLILLDCVFHRMI